MEDEWLEGHGKFSVVDRVSRWAHSGESSKDGCKMENSMVTKPDMCLLRKETKGRERARDEKE